MVPLDVCIMIHAQRWGGALGLIDVATQGTMLVAKWVVCPLEGTSPR